MRLTQQANYSVRTLMYCAANAGRSSRITDIARTYGISDTHLFKIMRILVDGGFIETIRGRHGGIRLARPPQEIGVGEVIRAAEANFSLADCFDVDRRDCPLVDSCGFNHVLREALDAFLAVLDRYTIADLAHDRNHLRLLLSLDPVGAAAS